MAGDNQGGRRALTAQIHADRDAARSGWAPALDPRWLRQASLFQAARAWGAAMPYADRAEPWYEPAAATAMRKTEERLRDLHPYAMARYDQLRADGMDPAEAMSEAAPLFARPPRAHDTPYAPRPVLTPGNGDDLAANADEPVSGEPGTLRTDESPVDPRDTGAAAEAVGTRARGTARPWEHDYPVSMHDVVAAAASAQAGPQPGRSAGPRPPADQLQRTSHPRP